MERHREQQDPETGPDEDDEIEWTAVQSGIPTLTLEEQLAIERQRRTLEREKASEGPEQGFTLERAPDPRESEHWFRVMDETTQSEIKGEWRLQAWLSDAVSIAWKDRRKQAYIDAFVIFVLSQTVFDPFRFSFLKLFAVLPVAVLVGWLWGRFKMGRFQSAIVGYPILLAFQLLTGLAPHSGIGDGLTFFYGGLAFCALAAMAGTIRESST